MRILPVLRLDGSSASSDRLQDERDDVRYDEDDEVEHRAEERERRSELDDTIA